MLRPVVAFATMFAVTGNVFADDISDSVCPILAEAAADLGNKAGYAVQSELVIAIAGEYEPDWVALRRVLDDIDTSTSAVCPEARQKILERVNADSLYAVLR